MSLDVPSEEAVVPSDRVIYGFLTCGCTLGAGGYLATILLADHFRGLALVFARAQAVFAGAAIPLIIVLGMLAYLEPSRSVRILSGVRRRSKQAADVLAEARSRLPQWIVDRLAIASVGYYAGTTIANVFATWLFADAVRDAPDAEAWLAPTGFAVVVLTLGVADRLIDKEPAGHPPPS